MLQIYVYGLISRSDDTFSLAEPAQLNAVADIPLKKDLTRVRKWKKDFSLCQSVCVCGQFNLEHHVDPV